MHQLPSCRVPTTDALDADAFAETLRHAVGHDTGLSCATEPHMHRRQRGLRLKK